MAKRWGSVEAARGTAGMCRTGGVVSFLLAVVFALLGIVGEAIGATLGLEPMSWYLLAIAAFLSSISWWIGWAVAIHIDVIKAKSK